MQRTGTAQYSLAEILGIWAAAALPMAALARVVAPLVADRLDGPVPLTRALIALLTVGLIWQFVLVMVLVHRERGSLRSEAVDVGEIARRFGGGGHKLAAGYTRRSMRPYEAKRELLSVLEVVWT